MVKLWNGGEGINSKGVHGKFGGDRNVLCLDCGYNYMTVYIYQNSLKCMLKRENFILQKFLPQKLKKNSFSACIFLLSRMISKKKKKES